MKLDDDKVIKIKFEKFDIDIFKNLRKKLLKIRHDRKNMRKIEKKRT